MRKSTRLRKKAADSMYMDAQSWEKRSIGIFHQELVKGVQKKQSNSKLMAIECAGENCG